MATSPEVHVPPATPEAFPLYPPEAVSQSVGEKWLPAPQHGLTSREQAA